MSFPIRHARWESDPEVLSRIGTSAMIEIISSVPSPQTSHQNRPRPANGQFYESYHNREIDRSFPIRGARWDITPSFPILIGLTVESRVSLLKSALPAIPIMIGNPTQKSYPPHDARGRAHPG